MNRIIIRLLWEENSCTSFPLQILKEKTEKMIKFVKDMKWDYMMRRKTIIIFWFLSLSSFFSSRYIIYYFLSFGNWLFLSSGFLVSVSKWKGRVTARRCSLSRFSSWHYSLSCVWSQEETWDSNSWQAPGIKKVDKPQDPTNYISFSWPILRLQFNFQDSILLPSLHGLTYYANSWGAVDMWEQERLQPLLTNSYYMISLCET